MKMNSKIKLFLISILFLNILLINPKYCNSSSVLKMHRGKKAKRGQFPSLVSLQIINFLAAQDPFCGGSLINQYHVLSAAHCLDSSKHGQMYAIACDIYTRKFTIFFGQKRKIIEGCIHPKYVLKTKPFLLIYDIAILKVDKAFSFTQKCHPLPISDTNSPTGTKCEVAGWGLTEKIKSTSEILLHGDTKVVDPKKCGHCNSMSKSKIPYSCPIICVNSDSGVFSCMGDSGTPLICNNMVEGVTSYGRGGCYEKVGFDRYTSTAASYEWIVNYVHRGNCTNVFKANANVIKTKTNCFILIIYILFVKYFVGG